MISVLSGQVLTSPTCFVYVVFVCLRFVKIDGKNHATKANQQKVRENAMFIFFRFLGDRNWPKIDP